jgi:hypothetical protein
MVTGLALFILELIGLASFFRIGVWVRWYKLRFGCVHGSLGSGYRVSDLDGLGLVSARNSMMVLGIGAFKAITDARTSLDRWAGFRFLRSKTNYVWLVRRAFGITEQNEFAAPVKRADSDLQNGTISLAGWSGANY